MKNHSSQLVRRYREAGLSIRQIAKKMRQTKYQIEKILHATRDQTPVITKVQVLLEPYRQEMTAWIDSRLPAKQVHRRLLARQIHLSESSVLRYVRTLRKPETYVPVHTEPGQEAQVDFGYFGRFQLDGKQVKVWVFCMVLAYSRYAFYTLVTGQSVATFLHCHAAAFSFFGGVPASLKIDNLRAGVLEPDFYQPLLQEQYAAFTDYHHTTVLPARVARGQDKGIVESGVKYVKNSFLTTVTTRDFASLQAELTTWNEKVCNRRVHRVTRQIPQEIYLKQEKDRLQPLPIYRYDIYHHENRTVNTFGHIYYQYNQYSVPHHYVGETVRITTNGTVLRVFKNDLQIALHTIHSSKGKFITETHHQPFHKRAKTDAYYRERMEKIGTPALALLERMIPIHPFQWKKMSNGIHRLLEKYPSSMVCAACEAILSVPVPGYRNVKEKCAQLSAEKTAGEPSLLKGVPGYAHDLKEYDQFVTGFTA